MVTRFGISRGVSRSGLQELASPSLSWVASLAFPASLASLAVLSASSLLSAGGAVASLISELIRASTPEP